MKTFLYAGDTLKFSTIVTGRDSREGWELFYRLIGASNQYDITSTSQVDDGGFLVDTSGSVTAAWAPGQYNWLSFVKRASDRVTLENGLIQIAADPATATALIDTRSQARKSLDDANAALAQWNPTKREYRIADRMMQFNSVEEILKLIGYWDRIVQSELDDQNKAAGLPGRFSRVKVAFRG